MVERWPAALEAGFKIPGGEPKNFQYDSLQDLGQELLPNSSIFEVQRNHQIDSLSYVKK